MSDESYVSRNIPSGEGNDNLSVISSTANAEPPIKNRELYDFTFEEFHNGLEHGTYQCAEEEHYVIPLQKNYMLKARDLIRAELVFFEKPHFHEYPSYFHISNRTYDGAFAHPDVCNEFRFAKNLSGEMDSILYVARPSTTLNKPVHRHIKSDRGRYDNFWRLFQNYTDRVFEKEELIKDSFFIPAHSDFVSSKRPSL